jgi:SOS response regulatory protein OraA/RecX
MGALLGFILGFETISAPFLYSSLKRGIFSMTICLAWSQFNQTWVEVRKGEEVLEEIKVSFPLRKLPTVSFLSLDDARAWLLQKEHKMATNQALRCLARQAMASTILFQKLQAKGYAADVCKAVVESCKPYFSDEQYWPRIVEKELAHGIGPRRITWKWKAKGLPEHLVEKIATPARQMEAIRRLGSKMKDRKKAFRILLQRGFDIEVVKTFCQSLKFLDGTDIGIQTLLDT